MMNRGPVESAWAELLPYMAPEELRELLDERGAFECWERGACDVHEPASWHLVAEVLAELLEHPSDVIEGEPLPRRRIGV